MYSQCKEIVACLLSASSLEPSVIFIYVRNTIFDLKVYLRSWVYKNSVNLHIKVL
jgi:hypothetical protein